MDQLLQREVALAERHSLPLSVVMIDMDHFKEINDAHGHAAGDHMLRAFADCVRMTLRKTDLAFRYGGDEFVIGLPQTPIGTREAIRVIAQRFANEVGVENVVTVVEDSYGGPFTIVVWFKSTEAERGMSSRVYLTNSDIRAIIKQSPDKAFPIDPVAGDSAAK